MTVDQSSWDARLAKAVGENVRRLRQGRTQPLSAQALSNVTRELGHSVHRSVIAKLENGERASVTLGDLFVLARALNVPPFALIAPLVAEQRVEVLPGRFMTSWDAVGWFNGDSNYVSDAVTQQDEGFTEWYAVTDAYQGRWRYQVEQLIFVDAYMKSANAEEFERSLLLARVDAQLDKLRSIREQLVGLGVEVPPIIDPTKDLEREPER